MDALGGASFNTLEVSICLSLAIVVFTQQRFPLLGKVSFCFGIFILISQCSHTAVSCSLYYTIPMGLVIEHIFAVQPMHFELSTASIGCAAVVAAGCFVNAKSS